MQKLLILGVAIVACIGYTHAAVGKLCTKAADCGTNEACTGFKPCKNKVCYCSAGYSYMSSEGCVKWRKVGEACTSKEVCAGGSTCKGDKCECHTSLVAASDNRQCVSKYPKLGEACETICSQGKCKDKKCACDDDETWMVYACLKSNYKLGKGKTCDVLAGSSADRCKPPYNCAKCVDEDAAYCMSGVATQLPSILGLLAAVFFSKWLL